MDAESEIEAVFTAFGVAAYAAQALERQLALTLASTWGPGSEQLTRSGYDALLKAYLRKTAGQLARQASGKLGDLATLRAEIDAAVLRRNFLMHDYFWERAVQFMRPEGRQHMLHELEEARLIFEALDAQLTALTRAWGEADTPWGLKPHGFSG